jgi:hypothetical protein
MSDPLAKIKRWLAQDFERWLVQEIDCYSRTKSVAPSADPLIVHSLLQKSIRRGESETAQHAAVTYVTLKGPAVWRRFIAIAFEDIGAGSAHAVAMTVATSFDDAWRKRCGGDAAVAPYLARLLASVPKSRSAEHLICGSEYHPSHDEARRDISESPHALNLAKVADKAHSLWHRALAAWCASGMTRRWGNIPVAGDLPALLDTYRNLGAPEELVTATRLAAVHTRKPITLMVPLVWLAAHEGQRPTVSENPVPPSPVIDGLPLYALDKHTRLGRKAIWRFIQLNEAVRGCLERHVPLARRPEAALMAAFYADAALLSKKLEWPGSLGLEALGIETDLLRSGVPPEGIAPILAVFRANLTSLNDARGDILLNARAAKIEAHAPRKFTA